MKTLLATILLASLFLIASNVGTGQCLRCEPASEHEAGQYHNLRLCRSDEFVDTKRTARSIPISLAITTILILTRIQVSARFRPRAEKPPADCRMEVGSRLT